MEKLLLPIKEVIDTDIEQRLPVVEDIEPPDEESDQRCEQIPFPLFASSFSKSQVFVPDLEDLFQKPE